MAPKLIDLKPNKLLLDSNFDGYKLSLADFPKKHKDLMNPVDRILLNTHQYSLLHSNVYGLHNHLISNPYSDLNSVYFVDNNFNLFKTYIDPFTNDLIDPLVILKIPKIGERKIGDYNVTLKFVSSSTAVIGDGMGTLFIVDTGNCSDDDPFVISWQNEEVAGQDEPFILVDAVLNKNESNPELHILGLSIKQSENEKFYSLIHWITFNKVNDSWGQIAIKQIKNNGCMQYAYLDKHCKVVYIASDNECKFIGNSEIPLIKPNTNSDSIEKNYQWSQTSDDITIKIILKDVIRNDLVKINQENEKIEILYADKTILSEELQKPIETNLTSWTVNKNILEIILIKYETRAMWSDLTKNVSNPSNLDAPVQFMNRTSEYEDVPQTGVTFNSQPVEECDFEIDRTAVLEVLCSETNTTTHKVILGSHQISLIALLTPGIPPAIGVRHDVDICLWQPQESKDFTVTHEKTLLAMGYVQASKSNRKFTLCPPDVSYVVICETSRHLFIYRQNTPISTGQLRNRNTGKHVRNIAEQHVVSLSNEEVLGLCPTQNYLYLLYANSIVAIKV